MRYVRRYSEELPVLAELLPHLDLPVTVVTGQRDHVVPLANAQFLADRVPDSELILLDAGHFLWEGLPDQYAAVVLGAINPMRTESEALKMATTTTAARVLGGDELSGSSGAR